MKVTPIDQAMLDELSGQAAEAPRRRLNRNFHLQLEDAAHRLLIAIEPDSYVVPHCHREASKDETMVCLRGRLGVVVFAADGSVDRSFVVAPGGECLGADIPHGVIHSVCALESGTVLFEAKAGPYTPVLPEERAGWAPAEGSPEAPAYLAWMRSLFA